ncbi:MAG TPA: NAD(P)/FAD-dependent oxidoreductase [Fimbriiglobus sp.]|jgi:flavin-dependent dehydrogenase|nr:NAD(P)/FAD-dependent oxidoreductase [Fimbriiglobus sp.]
MPDTASPDVIVIGGGPSGSTCSTILRQHGLSVDLFERETFPRFHIGESLIPMTYHVLKRTGMLEKMKTSHFVKKYSVQFINQRGKLSEPFYFIDHKPHESSQTWQVRRSEFDHLNLKNAAEHGVRVHENARVIEVLFEGDRAVGVRVKVGDEPEKVVRAKVVVDASGQSTMLQDRLDLREWDPLLKKAAVWTYWKGAYRDTGRDEGATQVVQTEGKKGWFWYIPLHDDVVSVGVVADYEYLFQNRPSKELEAIYFEEVARAPGLQPRLKDATRCDVFRAQKEYTYRAQKVAGDGWCLVGDAFGFLDPLYSSGVLLALTSGSMAADTIAEGIKKGDTSETQLRKWEPAFTAGMERMRKLVVEFYDGLSFGRFVRKHPDLKDCVTDVLIGDVFKDEVDVLWPLIDEMKAEHQAATGVKA